MDTPANRPVLYADLRLLRTEDGGRRGPIVSGYRCGCLIGNLHHGQPMQNDAMFELLDAAQVAPGGAARARVTPFFPEFWTRLRPGDAFSLCEGKRVVGAATVVPPVHPEEVG